MHMLFSVALSCLRNASSGIYWVSRLVWLCGCGVCRAYKLSGVCRVSTCSDRVYGGYCVYELQGAHVGCKIRCVKKVGRFHKGA